MTEDQKSLLAIFEERIRKVIEVCNEKDEIIAKQKLDLEQKETELEQAMLMIEKITAKYDNLLMAKVISAEESEIKNAKMRLSKLVREVDKCIALLNE
jgi:hypothetical protein